VRATPYQGLGDQQMEGLGGRKGEGFANGHKSYATISAFCLARSEGSKERCVPPLRVLLPEST
jgi:hypothetical protein